MARFTLYLVTLMAFIMFSACGGGGGSTTTTDATNISSQGASSSETVNNAVNLNQVVLGPLSGAEINVYRLSDLENPIETVTANNSTTDLALAGTFELELTDVNDSEWLLLTATGGIDIDANDDGIIDEIGISNDGSVFALVKTSDLKSGSVTITPLTDMVYSLLEDYLDLTSIQLENELNTLVIDIVKEDINHDGVIDYQDILVFDPLTDNSKLSFSWSAMLKGPVASIHDGNNINLRTQMYTSLIYIPTIEDSNNTIETKNTDDVVVYRVSDANGSTQEITVTHNQNSAFVNTKLTKDSEAVSGSTNILIDGHILNIQYPVDNTGIIADSIENIDESDLNISVDPYSNGYKITIPKALIALWSDVEAQVTIDGQPIELEVIDDDPVLYYGDDIYNPQNNGEYTEIESISQNDSRCIEYDKKYKICRLAELDAAIVRVLTKDEVEKYKEKNGNVYDDVIARIESLYTVISFAHDIASMTTLSGWISTIVTTVIDWTTSRTDLHIGETAGADDYWLTKGLDYTFLIMHKTAYMTGSVNTFYFTKEAYSTNNGTWFDPIFSSFPDGNIKLSLKRDSYYFIIPKSTVNVTTAAEYTNVDFKVKGGAWFRGRSSKTTEIRNPIVICEIDEKKDNNGNCVPKTCRDDNYGCPNCGSDEELKYNSDGSGYCERVSLSDEEQCEQDGGEWISTPQSGSASSAERSSLLRGSCAYGQTCDSTYTFEPYCKYPSNEGSASSGF